VNNSASLTTVVQEVKGQATELKCSSADKHPKGRVLRS
jgi:hypothetical protein